MLLSIFNKQYYYFNKQFFNSALVCLSLFLSFHQLFLIITEECFFFCYSGISFTNYYFFTKIHHYSPSNYFPLQYQKPTHQIPNFSGCNMVCVSPRVGTWAVINIKKLIVTSGSSVLRTMVIYQNWIFENHIYIYIGTFY